MKIVCKREVTCEKLCEFLVEPFSISPSALIFPCITGMTLSGTEVRKSQTEKLLKLNYVQKLILEYNYVFLKMHDSFFIPVLHLAFTTTSNFCLLKNIISFHAVTLFSVCLWLHLVVVIVAVWKQKKNKSFSRFCAVSWVYLHFSCSKGNERKCFMCYLGRTDFTS